MMRIYLVINDCPSDFDERDVIAVFKNRLKAQTFVNKRKYDDSYKNQYLTVKYFKVEDA